MGLLGIVRDDDVVLPPSTKAQRRARFERQRAEAEPRAEAPHGQATTRRTAIAW
jgi:hypothetical protein